MRLPLLFAMSFAAVWSASAQVPPVMNKRTIAPSTNELRGIQVALSDQGTNFTLFLPHGWTNAVSSNSTLCVHFHGAPWFVIQEHVRRGAKEPLAVFALGEGSSTYRAPFEDTNRFARVLALIESELRKRGAANAHIIAVDVSSFSAGYGAVRELVKSPGSFKILRRIALLDSIYGGLEPQQNGNTNRVPLAEHIDAWMPFARAAMRGEKMFVLAHSQVPTSSYASSAECAAALLARLGLKAQSVATNSVPAASDPNFPLRSRAGTNGLHIWSYAGTDAQAHMTHARHLADVWQALDVVVTHHKN
jgi:hypothetical protein